MRDRRLPARTWSPVRALVVVVVAVTVVVLSLRDLVVAVVSVGVVAFGLLGRGGLPGANAPPPQSCGRSGFSVGMNPLGMMMVVRVSISMRGCGGSE